MSAADRELVMTAIARQLPMLFDVGGVIYSGHVQSCLGGELVTVARPYGSPRGEWAEYAWPLDAIRLERQVEPDEQEEETDPLMEQARDFAARAKEWEALSLAERLLVNRNRGDTHGRSDS